MAKNCEKDDNLHYRQVSNELTVSKTDPMDLRMVQGSTDTEGEVDI